MYKRQLLYGIPSSGIHSNGYTLVRKLMKICDSIYPTDKIMTPTRIYNEIIDIYKTRGNNILGVAHITGGGFPDNIHRILPTDLTFELNHWEFPDIFKWIQKESNLTRNEMLRTFNCGYGMVIIIDKKNLSRVKKIIKKYKFKSNIIGNIDMKKSAKEKSIKFIGRLNFND